MTRSLTRCIARWMNINEEKIDNILVIYLSELNIYSSSSSSSLLFLPNINTKNAPLFLRIINECEHSLANLYALLPFIKKI